MTSTSRRTLLRAGLAAGGVGLLAACDPGGVNGPGATIAAPFTVTSGMVSAARSGQAVP